MEGTQLLELKDIAANGELTISPVLPIRGQYQMDVSVTPETATNFSAFTQSLTFSIPENPVKYRNAAILIGILLLIGLGSGWILGGDQTVQQGEIAPRPVRMLLSAGILLAIVVLLVINISAEIASAHGETIHEGTNSLEAIKQSQGIRAELSGDTQVTVGKMAVQKVTITDTAGEPVSDANLKIQALGLEHNELVFAYETFPDAAGQFTWKEQFFDGAPHLVNVEVMPSEISEQDFEPFSVGQEIDVEGIAPPLSVRFIGLFYYTSLFTAALAAGFSIRRWPRLGVRA